MSPAPLPIVPSQVRIRTRFAALWRLAWVGLRQSWLPVTVLGIIPPLLFGFGAHYPDGSALRQAAEDTALTLCGLTVAVWAVWSVGGRSKSGGQPLARLPVAPVSEWVVLFVAPAIAAGALGAWFGAWSTKPYGLYLWCDFAVLGAVAFAFYYGTAGLLTAVFSSWVALAVTGVVAVVGLGNLQSFRGSPGNVSMADWIAAYHVSLGSYAFCDVGALVGALVLLVLLRRHPFPLRRAASLGAALLVILPAVVIGNGVLGTSGEMSDDYSPAVLSTPDGSLRIAGSIIKGGESAGGAWQVSCDFRDYRANRRAHRTFAYEAQAIAFVGRTRVILARKHPGGRDLRIVEWNTRTGVVKPLLSIPLLESVPPVLRWSINSWMSPDRRRMVVEMYDGDDSGGTDLWLMDLRTRTATVMVPSELLTMDLTVTWLKAKILISGLPDPFEYDIARQSRASVPLPGGPDR